MEDLNGSIVQCSNDILTEILVRLPPKSIFKFTCVSRRWNNLIMDPCFIKRYDDCERRRRKGSSGGRLLGFVQCNTMRLTTSMYIFQPWVSRHSFLSVSHEGHSGCFPRELGYFISSSNGLFLCGCHPTTYHVVNPITKRRVSLPPPLKRFPYVSVGLACEERNHDFEVRYKVLVAGIYDALLDTLPIETFSSITGEWRESTLIAPYRFSISNYKPPIVIGGFFHWFNFRHSILAVYDSSLEESVARQMKHLQLIQLPVLAGSHALGRSNEGDLWYGSSNIKIFTIWMLPKGKQSSRSISRDEWISLHTVDMGMLKKSLPITEDIALEKHIIARQAQSKKSRAEMYEQRRLVYLVAFIPWDPRLVLIRLRESIFLYDLESDTIDSVELHGYPSFTGHDWEWYPYFDSVSLSSYALGLKQQQQLHIQPKCGIIT